MSTLTRWIERQLVSDQYARLEQAGHNLEEAIPLAPVFVDLEAPPGPREAQGSTFNPKLGFVWQAFITAPKLLRARERMIAPAPSPELSPERRHEPAGYVLIGAPGPDRARGELSQRPALRGWASIARACANAGTMWRERLTIS